MRILGSEYGSLALPQHAIDDLAAAYVDLVRVAAVVQDRGIFAAGVLQGVREDRHRAEVAGVVHRPRDADGGGGLPAGIEGDGAEGIAKDVEYIWNEL